VFVTIPVAISKAHSISLVFEMSSLPFNIEYKEPPLQKSKTIVKGSGGAVTPRNITTVTFVNKSKETFTYHSGVEVVHPSTLLLLGMLRDPFE
jgi:hypothetical protein